MNENSGCFVSGLVIGSLLFMGGCVQLLNGEGGGILTIILALIILVVGCFSVQTEPSRSKAKGASRAPNAMTPRGSTPPEIRGASSLQLLIKSSSEIVEGVRFPVLQLSSKGIFDRSKMLIQPEFEVRMWDITGGSGGISPPILTFVEAWQQAENNEFTLKIPLDFPLIAGAGTDHWVQFCKIPIPALIFPFRGTRTIQVDLRIRDLMTGDVRCEAAADWITIVEAFGYIEQEQVDEQAHAEAMKLAMCMAACDGQVDNREIATIKEWGSKSVNSLPDARQARRRKTLNEGLALATNRLRAGDAAKLLDEAVAALMTVGEEPHLYEAYELCLRVAKADGVADPEELALASRIARRLDLDDKKVKLLSDRHLSDIKIRSYGEPDSEDKILGIDSSMDKEDIRRHLNKLYQQNQAKRRSPDPEIRKRTEDMVERITKARRRHLG